MAYPGCRQTGIPARALRAYVAAAAMANDSAPMCGIGWNTVAAVGSVESAHGTYGGGSLNAAGQSSGPIVGPSLDGDGFAAIADTDAGVLDGDARWDHAVGPMQFIPTTWQLAGRDGNGDGTADPFNIDDAALSAATYLCAHGRDLSTARRMDRRHLLLQPVRSLHSPGAGPSHRIRREDGHRRMSPRAEGPWR